MVPFGRCSSLTLHAEYQVFLKANTKDEDSNPNLMIRVDVRGSTEAPPKKQGFTLGNRLPRPPLAPLDSLLNAISTTALPGFRALACSAAKPTASGTRALPAAGKLGSGEAGWVGWGGVVEGSDNVRRGGGRCVMLYGNDRAGGRGSPAAAGRLQAGGGTSNS